MLTPCTHVWAGLADANLRGPDEILVKPYEGAEPRGFILETIDTSLNVGGRIGRVVVKRNYGPEGVAVEGAA